MHSCQTNNDIYKLKLITAIIGIFMLFEIWGHFKTNSLSLLADALHLLVDISGFLISIFTLKISQRRPTNKYTFGYHRHEVLGALFSVLMIWIAALYLLFESFYRFFNPHEIKGGFFVGVAICGFIANVLCIYLLHHDHHHEEENHPTTSVSQLYQKTFDNFSFSSDFINETVNKPKTNLNIKATYTHIIGDIIQSIGIIIASIIIYFRPDLVIADVLCTIVFTILVIISTIPICKEGLYILSEGSPSSVNIVKVSDNLMTHPKILKVISINCWSVGVNYKAMIIKLLVDYIQIDEYENLLKSINYYIKTEEKIEIVTIEINTPNTNENYIMQ